MILGGFFYLFNIIFLRYIGKKTGDWEINPSLNNYMTLSMSLDAVNSNYLGELDPFDNLMNI